MKNGRNLSKVSAVSALQAKMVNNRELSPKAFDKYTSLIEREIDGNGKRSTESTLARRGGFRSTAKHSMALSD
jgi:hypothetical protein